jgi:hypothetical protein
MPELGPYGSVRGAAGNSRPYRERRDADTIRALLCPASKKRQGTKSRDVCGGGAAGAAVFYRTSANSVWIVF